MRSSTAHVRMFVAAAAAVLLAACGGGGGGGQILAAGPDPAPVATPQAPAAAPSASPAPASSPGPAPAPAPAPSTIVEPSPITSQQACVALAGKTIAGATVSATSEVAANGQTPLHCSVRAKIGSALNFEMRIPGRWNGKLHYQGGSGFNGYVPALEPTSITALSRGFITVSSDSGHGGNDLDAGWALDNPDAVAMYGFLSVPTVMASTLEMIKSTYGSAPARSYFEGCSNGGREGLASAQRYPALFNGIIARAPALSFTASTGAYQRNARAVSAPGGALSSGKLSLLSNAVLAACDGNDGVNDGVVSHLAACTFNAQTLRCAGGGDAGDSCLSDAQLATVNAVTTPAEYANGAFRSTGWALTGNENIGETWSSWITRQASLQFRFLDATIKYLVARNPSADSLAYDYNNNPSALARVAAAIDATSTDLRPYANRGGKLILWHGASDAALSYKTTTEYYQGVIAAVGSQGNADAFARYYVAPGVAHCGGGPGADNVDLLAALDGWVSNNTGPGDLGASRVVDGGTESSRPLCRFPQYPRYTGPVNDGGAARLAANYICTSP